MKLKDEFSPIEFIVTVIQDPDTEVLISEKWKLGGKLHRIGGPAVIDRDSLSGVAIAEGWYQHGKMHRDDGPAFVAREHDGTLKGEMFFQNGKRVQPFSLSGDELSPSGGPR